MSRTRKIQRHGAYIVRPSARLLKTLAEADLHDLAESLSVPTVVMTDALPYEQKLEGYRSLILRKCQEAFIAELREFIDDDAQYASVFGAQSSNDFDVWWAVEEADTIEINTDW